MLSPPAEHFAAGCRLKWHNCARLLLLLLLLCKNWPWLQPSVVSQSVQMYVFVFPTLTFYHSSQMHQTCLCCFSLWISEEDLKWIMRSIFICVLADTEYHRSYFFRYSYKKYTVMLNDLSEHFDKTFLWNVFFFSTGHVLLCAPVVAVTFLRLTAAQHQQPTSKTHAYLHVTHSLSS